MEFYTRVGFVVLVLCFLIKMNNKRIIYASFENARELEYDYYRDSCPVAYPILRRVLQDITANDSTIPPALLRLLFHDCFVGGCDASVLLDDAIGTKSEKNSGPSLSLRGFDVIDRIKTKIEEECPGIVSCADILVLAARESVLLTGGQYYPLLTGRRDSIASFYDLVVADLPNPDDRLPMILKKFAKKGFSERETVSLLGAHSTGRIHCEFFEHRLTNDQGNDSMDPEFANVLKERCKRTPATSSDTISTFPERTVNMDYEGPGVDFGGVYYRSLLNHRGILVSDQELTAGIETEVWVRAYASDSLMFRQDFALAMMKLSNTHVLTAPLGQVRSNCRKLV